MRHAELKRAVLALGLIIASQKVIYAADCHGQKILTERDCIGDELSAEEKKLYQTINRYRIQNGLPYIPSSPSLDLVANRHVLDIAENSNHYARDGQNWLHGWSNCPYDADKGNTFSCMWEAPKRLGTLYPGYGYENICGSPEAKYQHFIMSAEYAFKSWQKSGLHNEVILNQGTWKNYRWNAMGIGIYKGYAALWLGVEKDPLFKTSDKGTLH